LPLPRRASRQNTAAPIFHDLVGSAPKSAGYTPRGIVDGRGRPSLHHQ
jgi:hypothetical protein